MSSRESNSRIRGPGQGGTTWVKKLIVFEGRETCPLPPLYGFAIYFTHPDATPDTVDPVKLLEAIRRDTPLESNCSIRLDIYFLLASGIDNIDDECIVHYHGEKATRGDYTHQIQVVENLATNHGGEQYEIEASVAGSDGIKHLPGLVPSYINNPTIDYYHGLLHSYQGPNWRIDKRLVRRVYFDPFSLEEYVRLAEEAGESEILSPTSVALVAIQMSDFSEQGATLVGMSMFEISHLKTENETNEPWQEAVERGWTSW